MKKILLVAVLFTALSTSCKKESSPVVIAPADLTNTVFKGIITFTGIDTYDNATITFSNNGVADYFFRTGVTGKGTWGKSPSSNLVNIVYNGSVNNVWKLTGTVNAEGTKIENGILMQTAGGSGTGTFTMTKQ
jgi:hypothetical protein